MSLLAAGGLDYMAFKGAFQPKLLHDSAILWIKLGSFSPGRDSIS